MKYDAHLIKELYILYSSHHARRNTPNLLTVYNYYKLLDTQQWVKQLHDLIVGIKTIVVTSSSSWAIKMLENN